MRRPAVAARDDAAAPAFLRPLPEPSGGLPATWQNITELHATAGSSRNKASASLRLAVTQLPALSQQMFALSRSSDRFTFLPEAVADSTLATTQHYIWRSACRTTVAERSLLLAGLRSSSTVDSALQTLQQLPLDAEPLVACLACQLIRSSLLPPAHPTARMMKG